MESVINGGIGLSDFIQSSIVAFKIIFRLIEELPFPIASACLWKEHLDAIVSKIQRLKFLISNCELVPSCLFAVSKKENPEIREKASCRGGSQGGLSMLTGLDMVID